LTNGFFFARFKPCWGLDPNFAKASSFAKATADKTADTSSRPDTLEGAPYRKPAARAKNQDLSLVFIPKTV
jgi:hypothetical protein